MERIEDCISFLCGKAAQAVARVTREGLAPHGVTPAQYAVLQVLWERDGQSGAEIGGRLVLDSATVTGLLDRLEKQGLVRRGSAAGDRRVNLITLTEAGLARREPLQAAMDAINADLARQLGADTHGLAPLLRRLAAVTGKAKEA